jgi:hypothetical protein
MQASSRRIDQRKSYIGSGMKSGDAASEKSLEFSDRLGTALIGD